MLEQILASKPNVSEYHLPLYGDCECLYAQVFFGSPNKNCAGTGICKAIMPQAHQDQVGVPLLQCDFAKAVILYQKPNYLCFNFERSSICKRSLKKHFNQNIFIVETPFLFTSPDHTFQFEVKAGAYPVETTDEFLRVVF